MAQAQSTLTSIRGLGRSLPQPNVVFEPRRDDLLAPARELGAHEGKWVPVYVRPSRDRAVTADEHGQVLVWDLPSARLERTLKSPADARICALDPKGRFLATSPNAAMSPRSFVLFDLAAPRGAEPTPLLTGEYTQINGMT